MADVERRIFGQHCYANMVFQPVQSQATIGAGGVPAGSKTSEYYRTKNIPERFDNPGNTQEYNLGNPVFSGPTPKLQFPPQQTDKKECFQGYESKPVAPMYRTTNSEYGGRNPSVHTMPTEFHAKSQAFTQDLGKCGMFRNHSLNCAMDKSNVPDH